MGIKTSQQTGRLVYELTGDSRDDVNEIQQKIGQFLQLIPPDAKVLIKTFVVINGESERELRAWQIEQVELLRTLGRYFRTVAALLSHFKVSRASYYNWMNGIRISSKRLEMLVENPPTPELGERILSLKSTYRREGLI